MLAGEKTLKPIARAVNVPLATVRTSWNECVDGGCATKEPPTATSARARGRSADPGNTYALTKKGRSHIAGELERWVRIGQQESEITVIISIKLAG